MLVPLKNGDSTNFIYPPNLGVLQWIRVATYLLEKQKNKKKKNQIKKCILNVLLLKITRKLYGLNP